MNGGRRFHQHIQPQATSGHVANFDNQESRGFPDAATQRCNA